MAEAAAEFVYTLYVAAPAERVWDALVDSDLTRKYWGHENRSDWRPGSRWEHVRLGHDGKVDIAGKVIEIDPPHRLVTSWASPADLDDPAKVSRVTYEITPLGDEAKLTVIHSELRDAGMLKGISSGWPMVLSSLKTFLESGVGMEVVRAKMREMEAQ